MKTKKPDDGRATRDAIWRMLGRMDDRCVSRKLPCLAWHIRDRLEYDIRRAIRAAEKRGALAERERIERYIKERRISSPNLVVVTTCADILTDIDHGARPARKARKGGAK